MTWYIRLVFSAVALVLATWLVSGCGLLQPEPSTVSDQTQSAATSTPTEYVGGSTAQAVSDQTLSAATSTLDVKALTGIWRRDGEIEFGSDNPGEKDPYIGSIFIEGFEVLSADTPITVASSITYAIATVLPNNKLALLNLQKGQSIILSFALIYEDVLILYIDDFTYFGFSVPFGIIYRRVD